jgi:predicted O-methyltransferase YrrM
LYTSTQLALRYLRYLATASNGKGHGIHSPFVFDFITTVLNDKKSYPAYAQVESLRTRLRTRKEVISVDDFGAGSVTGSQRQRSIASITANAAKSRKLGQLLFRMVQRYQPATMLELGTSLGISSAYLALGNPQGKLFTCEGAAAVAEEAKKNFTALQIPNVHLTQGNFDDTLQPLLQKLHKVDLAFIDGNHREEPTVQYFEAILAAMNRPGILIFDDIHWSAGMERAWELVKANSASMLTADLFFLGIVFLNDNFKVKQHFVIRF